METPKRNLVFLDVENCFASPGAGFFFFLWNH